MTVTQWQRRDAIAAELDAAGWHAVAEDVRDGLALDTILRRLREIGEGESEASDIIQWPKGWS
jgi:hypothetical protein